MDRLSKNILLIAGTGQNVGKTLFASQVIAHHASRLSIVSIKISPHFHKIDANSQIVEQGTDYIIIKENNKLGNKDSQRLLNAGSKDVYYIQCHDEQLPMVFSKLKKHIPNDLPIICEAGGLRQFIKPGLFLMIDKKNNKNIKPRARKNRELADKWIEFDEHEFDFDPKHLHFSESGWKIQN